MNPVSPGTPASSAPAPVHPHQRIVAVDILRGFAVLGILLVNMLSFSGYFHIPPHQQEQDDRVAMAFPHLWQPSR